MSSIAERRKFILDHITESGFVKVAELAEYLNVTQTTIRKDLNALENKGILKRAYGSAMLSSSPVIDMNMGSKRLIHYKEKQAIAIQANTLVEDNDSIIISAGSTMGVFAEVLSFSNKRVHIVTPAVNVSMILGDKLNITTMQLGGILYGNSLCVTGTEAIKKLDSIHCSKVLFGVDGFDIEYGATCATPEEAEMTRRMIQVCDTSIVLADSSKIGNKGFSRICHATDVDTLITDSGISKEDVAAIEKKGIKVIVAEL